MKYYLILGHPTKDSFNGQLIDAYEKKLLEKGHDVKRVNIIDLDFEINLSKSGFSEKTAKVVKNEQANIKWADEIIFFYPLWWGGIPAILKGYIDNVFQKGFAYKYRPNSSLWDKLLRGKTARIFSTCDAPSFFVSLVYKNADFAMLKRAVCWFTGIKVSKAKRIDKLIYRSENKRKDIINKITSKIK
ncbi:NAD(P)H-dependent oxidoreductase [Metamycoplasma equirhinis]|uniref:NAD(P)H-dependent oxidoreductase n=1 Tax=Metamycoplasma equirhinis TaxID=92402 RepID=UPI0035947B54